MIKAYFDYPNTSITIHRNPNCLHAKVGPDEIKRHVIVNADNLSQELKRFRSDARLFSTEAGRSDLYLILDFVDPVFEEALVAHLRRLTGLNYKEMANCKGAIHLSADATTGCGRARDGCPVPRMW